MIAVVQETRWTSLWVCMRAHASVQVDQLVGVCMQTQISMQADQLLVVQWAAITARPCDHCCHHYKLFLPLWPLWL